MSYYKIQNFEHFKHYNKSVREPRKWGKIAEENFTWYQLWDKVVESDMAEAEIKWFTEKIEHS
jgi:acetyl-CoA synthetase